MFNGNDSSVRLNDEIIIICFQIGRIFFYICFGSVSYTHLDVYKRQAPLRTVRGSDFVVTVPFKLVVGVTVVLSELEEPVELVLT